ncbi:MAG: hypothetical protein AVO33_10280 [delta proteobacterium ML8_F1]|nr:MAG: hypothetical protein AVO33_10280 [delta proteobacterium ML8_F1]
MEKFDCEKALIRRQRDAMDQCYRNSGLFILGVARKVLGRHVTREDEAYGVASMAFFEAMKGYDSDKGPFFAFAKTVITRRLIDDLRKEEKHRRTVPVDPLVFGGEFDEEEGALSIGIEIRKNLVSEVDEALKDEIENLKEIIAPYGFTFMDLIQASPKARKTKAACDKAITYLIKTPLLRGELQSKKTLPLKIIEKNAQVPQKILQRHRKYIITAVEILSGDFPNLAEYLESITKKEGSFK